MNSFYNYTLPQLEAHLTENGVKPSRAKVMFGQIYKSRQTRLEPSELLTKKTADLLNGMFDFKALTLRCKTEEEDVCKLLLGLSDGNSIETVIMKHDFGNSVCVSTQIGCNMGCAFCESGRLKRVRNLSAAEIVLQVLAAENEVGSISNVVLMGIGEPFDNYEASMSFIDIISSPFGLDIGPRHITVSTSGIVPKIREYGKRPVQNNLAISLHAPDDEIRGRIMQINKAYPLSELMAAVREYSCANNKRVTFEYIMLNGVNDSPECADKLAELLKGLKCYVNLIPYNETAHIEFHKSSRERITLFYERLKSHGVWVTIRHEFGAEVKAACGQLRAEYSEKNNQSY